MGADTLVEPSVDSPRLDTETGDHDRFTHIVRDVDKLTESYVLGTPVEALCGKVWVPSRDPDRYPVCQTCVAEFERETGQPWPGRR